MSDFIITVNEVNLRATNPVGEYGGFVIKAFSEIQESSAVLNPNAFPLLGHPLSPSTIMSPFLMEPHQQCAVVMSTHKGSGLSLATCTPSKETGLSPACISAWLHRHKLVCALQLDLISAFWLVFYHRCQLFQDLSQTMGKTKCRYRWRALEDE